MIRGPLSNLGYKGQFTGHETFPLRHLWLRKVHDEVTKNERGAEKGIFSNPESIVTFGLGKNMVSSMRHWALACGIIEPESDRYVATKLAMMLFSTPPHKIL